MEFAPTENQQLIAQTVKDFAEKHIRPNVMKWDESQEFPVEVFKKMGETGLMGVLVPTEYGGAGLSYFEYVTAIVEVARVCGAVGLSMAAHNSLCTGHIMTFGNEEQKKKWLPKLATAEWIGAWGLTEANTGSDAMRMQCVAKKDGDSWVINGTKNWITNGGNASTYLVIAQTDASKGHKGINVLIVEKGMPGFEVGPKEKKMGIRGSDTHTLLFNDVKVPKENRIGADGFGFAFAMSTLNGGRIGIASQALGIAQGAYELALKYSQERVAFGKPIFNHQAIAFKLADMHVKITCARLLIHKAATEKDNGEDIAHSGAMAKLYASEIALEVANEAVQIHGGNGYVSEYHVERMMRDAKITQIYEGTSEIQRIVISRGLVK